MTPFHSASETTFSFIEFSIDHKITKMLSTKWNITIQRSHRRTTCQGRKSIITASWPAFAGKIINEARYVTFQGNLSCCQKVDLIRKFFLVLGGNLLFFSFLFFVIWLHWFWSYPLEVLKTRLLLILIQVSFHDTCFLLVNKRTQIHLPFWQTRWSSTLSLIKELQSSYHTLF